MSLSALLRPVREIPGIEGFLLLNAAGEVVARQLNAIYDESTANGVAARVVTLVEASREVVREAETMHLRFRACALAIRRGASHTLVTISSHGANSAALAVAGRLVLRRADEDAAARERTPEATPGARPPASRPRGATPSPRRAKKLRRSKKGIWG